MYDTNHHRTVCHLLRGLAGVLVFFLGSASATAQDFKTHYDLALALYQAQKFEESIPEFKAAYQLSPKPALLFNLAQAYRKAGHPREALREVGKGRFGFCGSRFLPGSGFRFPSFLL